MKSVLKCCKCYSEKRLHNFGNRLETSTTIIHTGGVKGRRRGLNGYMGQHVYKHALSTYKVQLQSNKVKVMKQNCYYLIHVDTTSWKSINGPWA